jgi:hypothetical protein
MNEGWTSTETLSVSYITVRVHADCKLYRLRRRAQLVAGWAKGDTIVDGAIQTPVKSLSMPLCSTIHCESGKHNRAEQVFKK